MTKPRQVYRPVATLSLEEREEIYNDPEWIKRISNSNRSKEDSRKLRSLIATFRKEGVIDAKYILAIATRGKIRYRNKRLFGETDKSASVRSSRF
jgi:hypothetical protein